MCMTAEESGVKKEGEVEWFYKKVGSGARQAELC